jgi:hypothetical protein
VAELQSNFVAQHRLVAERRSTDDRMSGQSTDEEPPWTFTTPSTTGSIADGGAIGGSL